MKTFAAGLMLLCGISAAAEEAAWKFAPGQTFTWECETKFHYAVASQTMTPEEAAAFQKEQCEAFRKSERERTDHAAGLTYGHDPVPSDGRATSTASASSGDSDPQTECVTLEATVLAIGDDGAARIAFKVSRIRVEIRFDSTGEHAEWDSARSKVTLLTGLKRYEARLGREFEAVVGADGTIREVKSPADVILEGPQFVKASKRADRAAKAMHDPTPDKVWLEVLFGIAPTRKEASRVVALPGPESVEVSAARFEMQDGLRCLLSTVRSKRRDFILDAATLPPDATTFDVAMAGVRAAEKKGSSWFSTDAGCLVGAELRAQTSVARGRGSVVTDYQWKVTLKGRGLKDLSPKEGEGPVFTK